MNHPSAKIGTPTPGRLLLPVPETQPEHRLLEAGTRALTASSIQSLESSIPALLEAAAIRRRTNPKRAGQIELLVRSMDAGPELLPEVTRREASFALLYFSKRSGFPSDPVQPAGFVKDEAVIELVLSRHAREFEEYCCLQCIEWSALKPPARLLRQTQPSSSSTIHHSATVPPND